MEEVNQCLLCEGPIAGRKAMVAPFLAGRIWGKRPFRVSLETCKKCGFHFYNPRPDLAEISRLYSNYRQAPYQKDRQKFEPWYTEKLNSAIDCKKILDLRKQALSKLLSKQLNKYEIKNILDFGGGRGYLIENLVPGAKGAVYDVSGVKPIDGIISMPNLEACAQMDFDLVVCSNVLEHVSSPKNILEDIKSFMRPNKLVFIEVPYETPFGHRTVFKRIIQLGILSLLRPKISFSILRPGLFYWMHEHINYFNQNALEGLIQSVNMKIIASGVYDCQQPSGLDQFVWCLAKL